MTKKMTKREMFEQIKNNYNLTIDEMNFIDHEIELLTRKNRGEKKLTANQLQNEELKEVILNFLTSNCFEKFTITELLKQNEKLADFTNQKINALVKQLVEKGAVVRLEEKGRAYFQANV